MRMRHIHIYHSMRISLVQNSCKCRLPEWPCPPQPPIGGKASKSCNCWCKRFHSIRNRIILPVYSCKSKRVPLVYIYNTITISHQLILITITNSWPELTICTNLAHPGIFRVSYSRTRRTTLVSPVLGSGIRLRVNVSMMWHAHFQKPVLLNDISE